MHFNIDKIVKDTNKIVRKKSEDVTLPLCDEDRELLLDMLQYVRDSQDPELAKSMNLKPAVGIAAVQIGILKKMLAVVVPVSEDEKVEFALVNPKIISESMQRAYLASGEGCLSVDKEHQGYVPRAARITVKAYDLVRDEIVNIKAEDYLAIVLQHEIDHFSGTLFYDHINKQNPWQEIEDAIVIE